MGLPEQTDTSVTQSLRTNGQGIFQKRELNEYEIRKLGGQLQDCVSQLLHEHYTHGNNNMAAYLDKA